MFHVLSTGRKCVLGCGLALAIIAPAHAAGGWTFKLLHTFAGVTDGYQPQAGLLVDGSGNLFGTTYAGGSHGGGTVFEVTAGGTETVLYSFCAQQNCADGEAPSGPLVEDNAGNLYGTTQRWGANGNFGTVYKLSPSGVETVLHSFSVSEAYLPLYGGLVANTAGDLFGTTSSGGLGAGAIFEVAADGTETVLHSFGTLHDGSGPNFGFAEDDAGNFFGTTPYGGAWGYGAAYKLAPDGTETLLHSFNYNKSGCAPEGTLVADGKGNYYGTASCGGKQNWGMIFKLNAKGHYKSLYSFQAGMDGWNPQGPLSLDSHGNIYGTTLFGGGTGCNGNGCGTVFELPHGGKETVLYVFTGGNDGGVPSFGVVADSTGNLYGTTFDFFNGSLGTVFELQKTR